MTKEEYLKSLELALIEAKVDNYAEIVEKYRKRFELASLADMTTEEAIKMMGSIESVVKKYCNDEKTEYYEVYTFKIDDALASEIIIKRGSKPGIVINVDEDLIDKLNINHQEHKVSPRSLTQNPSQSCALPLNAAMPDKGWAKSCSITLWTSHASRMRPLLRCGWTPKTRGHASSMKRSVLPTLIFRMLKPAP